MLRKIGVYVIVLATVTSCFSIDAPDKDLLKMADRLGKLHCVSNHYHEEMGIVLKNAKMQNMEKDSLFLFQKRLQFKCLRALNSELIDLQNDFDQQMLLLGGYSSAKTKPYYNRLELIQKNDSCSFIEYCDLNFEFINKATP